MSLLAECNNIRQFGHVPFGIVAQHPGLGPYHTRIVYVRPNTSYGKSCCLHPNPKEMNVKRQTQTYTDPNKVTQVTVR